MHRDAKRSAPLLALVAPLLILAPWLAASQTARAPTRCAAALVPDTARIQTQPVTIGYTLPDSAGTATGVMPENGSGIIVGMHDGSARTVMLQMQSATSGRWSLTFDTDSSATCVGTLEVLGPTPLR